VEEQLLGTVKEQAGGAIVLSDGANWFYKIYVKIDIEVDDAGQVELLCILIANEMIKARGIPAVVGSDCISALNVAEGAYSERFYNTIAGWKKWGGTTTKQSTLTLRDTSHGERGMEMIWESTWLIELQEGSQQPTRQSVLGIGSYVFLRNRRSRLNLRTEHRSSAV
jgi:hypothetical protein